MSARGSHAGTVTSIGSGTSGAGRHAPARAGQAVSDGSEAHTDSDITRAMPERYLWVAVLIQALRDAVSNPTKMDEHNRARRAARIWLTRPSRDLREVCEVAGIEPRAVLEFSRSLESQGWPVDGIRGLLTGWAAVEAEACAHG